MAAPSISWVPAQGRHPVNIGPSLGRAIKARKLKDSPAPIAKRNNLPERDFYSFRYNFKPAAIDSAKVASIETKRVADSTQIIAEFPSKDVAEVTTYNGTEVPAKEIECVLIFDEDTGQYSLEKLDSFVSLQFGGKRTVSTPPVPDKGQKKQEEEEDDLERMILGDSHAPDGPDIPVVKTPPVEEIEEGEEPEVPLRRPSPLPPPKLQTKPPLPTVAGPARPTKSLPKSREPKPSQPSTSTSTPTPLPASLPPKPPATTAITTPTPAAIAAKPKPVPKPKQKKVKPAVPPPSTTNALALPDEEVFEIPKPAAPKKLRPSTKATATTSYPPKAAAPALPPPQPKAPAELSLPGAGDSGFVPLAVPGVAPPVKKASTSVAAAAAMGSAPAVPPSGTPVPPGVSANLVMEEYVPGEEEEDEWEPVATRELEDEIFGDLLEEEPENDNEDMVELDIDAADALEAELNQQMDLEMDAVFGEDSDEDDDMEDAMEDVSAAADGDGGKFMSLNKMATGLVGGGGEADSEDDFSTSDSDSD